MDDLAITGFIEYLSKIKPEEVFGMLKNLFVEFDRKCCDLNVNKLYTIIDFYVAIEMIDYHNRNPHQEAKMLQIQLLKLSIVLLKYRNFDGFNMRRGVYTKSVLEGVGRQIEGYLENKLEVNECQIIRLLIQNF